MKKCQKSRDTAPLNETGEIRGNKQINIHIQFCCTALILQKTTYFRETTYYRETTHFRETIHIRENTHFRETTY